MPNMAFSFEDRLFILVHNDLNPSKEEWKAYVEVVKQQKDPNSFRTLVITDGGGPDHEGRADLNMALGYTSTLTAVVAGSTLVRTIVSALNFFNKQIRAFSPQDMPAAFSHLKLTDPERDKVLARVRQLGAQGGSRATKLAA